MVSEYFCDGVNDSTGKVIGLVLTQETRTLQDKKIKQNFLPFTSMIIPNPMYLMSKSPSPGWCRMTPASDWVNQPVLSTVILCRPRNEREVFLFNFMRIQKPATALLLDRKRTIARG